MSNKPITIKLGSLNCQSLIKTNSHKQSQFFRYLLSSNFDLLTFQESHGSDQNITRLNRQLNTHQALWTPHCGIVSYSTNYCLSPNLISNNDRVILTQITHFQGLYDPFFLLTVYAPAGAGHRRRAFFDNLYQLLLSTTLSIDLDRLIITGDFNYSYDHLHLFTHTSADWVSFLHASFTNALTAFDINRIPTYTGFESRSSTIDYIFVGNRFHNQVIQADIERLPNWSDHSILVIDYRIGSSRQGHGLWRANPLLLKYPEYKYQLIQATSKLVNSPNFQGNPQEQWDLIKACIKKATKAFAIEHSEWRTRRLRKLHSQRNFFLRSKPAPLLRLKKLKRLDKIISTL
jgi:exonuclease III